MAALASAREWHGPSVPGITGTPCASASFRADVLSPNKPSTFEGGPMKAMLASSHACSPHRFRSDTFAVWVGSLLLRLCRKCCPRKQRCAHLSKVFVFAEQAVARVNRVAAGLLRHANDVRVVQVRAHGRLEANEFERDRERMG